jgi:hypothetical protein
MATVGEPLVGVALEVARVTLVVVAAPLCILDTHPPHRQRLFRAAVSQQPQEQHRRRLWPMVVVRQQAQ